MDDQQQRLEYMRAARVKASQLEMEVRRYTSQGRIDLDALAEKVDAARQARDKAAELQKEYDEAYPTVEVAPPEQPAQYHHSADRYGRLGY